MKLTNTACKNAKPADKPRKLSDGGGLYLQIMPNGSKYWRLKYRFASKEKRLALGVYPEVGLADARDRAAQARRLLAANVDPAESKKEARRLLIAKGANTFETVAREWLEHRRHEWIPDHYKRIKDRLERHALPTLRHRPIAEITAPELLEVFRVIEKAGTLDTMQRVVQCCRQIFMYAIASGRVDRNPVADIRGALKTPVRKHYAHLKEDDLPDYLVKLEAYDGEPVTKFALKMLMLTFVRTTELRATEWKEINFDAAEWKIPAARMKMRDPHIVPLCRQAIAVLRDLQKHSGNRQHVFPNLRNPSAFMSENTMLYALYRMGYHSRTTGHGFRSTASTILNEKGFAPDVIERQLAHSERNSVRAAYNHAQYLPERRKMMQWWADYLDEIAAKKVSH
jgi:integrase